MSPSNNNGNIHPYLNRHRRSKAQTCLFKILQIISVFPAGDIDHKQCLTSDDENCQNRSLNFDFNVRLRHPPEIEPIEPIKPIEPPVTAENDGDAENCNNRSGESEEDKRRDEGCLGLLIQAAQLILGEHESKPAVRNDVVSPAAAEVGCGTKRKQERWTAEWWPEFEGTLPALKSKRGRNLVLPEKYKDSFVEPVIRWTPSVNGSKGRSKR